MLAMEILMYASSQPTALLRSAAGEQSKLWTLAEQMLARMHVLLEAECERVCAYCAACLCSWSSLKLTHRGSLDRYRVLHWLLEVLR